MKPSISTYQVGSPMSPKPPLLKPKPKLKDDSMGSISTCAATDIRHDSAIRSTTTPHQFKEKPPVPAKPPGLKFAYANGNKVPSLAEASENQKQQFNGNNSRSVSSNKPKIEITPDTPTTEKAFKVKDFESKEDAARAENLRKRYACSGATGNSSSLEEQQCCSKLALNVVQKAWEGAKKALPHRSTAKKDDFPRSFGESFDTVNPASYPYIDSDNEPPTECSLDYEEDTTELQRESVFQLRSGVFKPQRQGARPKLGEIPSDSEESEDRASPDELELDRFKNKYMADNVIPEETEEDIMLENSELNTNMSGSKTPEKRKKNLEFVSKKADISPIRDSKRQRLESSPKLDKYAMSTSEHVMNAAKEKASHQPRLSTASDDKSVLADDEQSISEKGNSLEKTGVFRLRPKSTEPLKAQESQESTDAVESITCDIPTLTITEDELEDASCRLSAATLRTNDDELTDISEDIQQAPQTRKQKIKSKVKELGGKVKVIFGKHENTSATASNEEKKRKKELKEQVEQTKQAEVEAKKREELAKKEQEAKRVAEEEKKKREEEAKQKRETELKKREAELLRKEEELFKEALEHQRKEDERLRKEEEKRKKGEEKKKKEEENRRKKEEVKKKLLNDLKQNIAAVAEIVKPNKDSANKENQDVNCKEKTLSEETNGDQPIFSQAHKSIKSDQETEKEFDNQVVVEAVSSPVVVEMKLSDHEYYNVQVIPKSDNVVPSPSSQSPEPKSDRVDVLSLLKSEPRIVGESRFKQKEEDFFNSDSEEEFEAVAPKRRKKIKRKLITTRDKLKNFKDRALESIPKMDKLKNKVKDFFPKQSAEEAGVHEYEKITNLPSREQEVFDEYKLRYPTVDVEFFSDSELIESRKSTARRQFEQQKMLDEQANFYEEMAATEERLHMLLTPVSGPLRPPRKIEIKGTKMMPAASDPTLSKQPPSTKLRRVPPPRPPLPENFTSMESFADQDSYMRDVDLNESRSELIRQQREDTLPPNLFYKAIREKWQENNLKRLEELISRSTPNLQKKKTEPAELYDTPKRLRPIRPPSPKLYDRPKAPRRSLKDGAVIGKPPLAKPLQNKVALQTGPVPPPRFKRLRQCHTPMPFATHSTMLFKGSDKAKIATDPLYWRAFTWKTGRCRSLTELYLRKKELKDSQSLQDSLRYRLTIKYCVPPRPPLPENLPNVSANEPIYSFINKGAKKLRPSSTVATEEKPSTANGAKMRDRPLPPPPVPPRPKSRSHEISSSTESVVARNESAIVLRPLSPNSLSVRDACVSTKDNGFLELYEKEVQTSLEDLTEEPGPEDMIIKPSRMLDVNANIPSNVDPRQGELSHDQSSVPNINGNNTYVAVNDKRQLFGDDISITSTITGGSYYDAEEEDEDDDYDGEEEGTDIEHHDQDTFADVESIVDTSQFVSVSDATPLNPSASTPLKTPLSKTNILPPSSTDTYFSVDSCTTIEQAQEKHQPESVEVEQVGVQQSLKGEAATATSQPLSPGTYEGDMAGFSLRLGPPEDGLNQEELKSKDDHIDDGTGIPIRIERTSDDPSKETASVTSDDTSSVHSRNRLSLPQARASLCSSDEDVEDEYDDAYSYSSEQQSTPVTTLEKAKKKESDIFLAAKEMMTSEQVYVNVLHFLNEDFRAAVAPYLPEEVLNSLLKHLPNLLMVNEKLLEEFKERINNWSVNPRIAQVLIQIGPFLKQYSFYIKDFQTIYNELDDARKKYPAFHHALAEFEKSDICKKLPVRDYLLKPVQRLPQYKLLLQNYLKHLEPVDHPDKEDAEKALMIVTQAAEHANNLMKEDDNFARLLRIQHSLMGSHEIIKPGRVILKQGELMKLSRKGMQPRLFILCNDCLLYLTLIQQGMYRLNYELPLLGMRVSVPTQVDYQNEFGVITQTRSFMLSASSPKEKEDWLQVLNKTIKEYVNRRSTFVNDDSYNTCSNEESTTPLGHEAPVWIPDNRVTMCLLCTEEFTVTFRRHHCRACGRVVCSNCSSNKAPLKYLKYRADRVCDECFEKLQQQLQTVSRSHSTQTSSGEIINSESDENQASSGSTSLNWESLKDKFVRMPIRASGRKPKHVPKVLKEVAANDQGSSISGYLYRRKHKKCWTKRWFVIKNNVLYSYKGSEDIKAYKTTVLLGYNVSRFVEPVDEIDPTLLFQLTHHGQPDLIFKAETPAAVEKWMKAMQDATVLT